VNGINLNDPVQNQITFQPPIDTLAEYKIDNSSLSGGIRKTFRRNREPCYALRHKRISRGTV